MVLEKEIDMEVGGNVQENVYQEGNEEDNNSNYVPGKEKEGEVEENGEKDVYQINIHGKQADTTSNFIREKKCTTKLYIPLCNMLVCSQHKILLDNYLNSKNSGKYIQAENEKTLKYGLRRRQDKKQKKYDNDTDSEEEEDNNTDSEEEKDDKDADCVGELSEYEKLIAQKREEKMAFLQSLRINDEEFDEILSKKEVKKRVVKPKEPSNIEIKRSVRLKNQSPICFTEKTIERGVWESAFSERNIKKVVVKEKPFRFGTKRSVRLKNQHPTSFSEEILEKEAWDEKLTPREKLIAKKNEERVAFIRSLSDEEFDKMFGEKAIKDNVEGDNKAKPEPSNIRTKRSMQLKRNQIFGKAWRPQMKSRKGKKSLKHQGITQIILNHLKKLKPTPKISKELKEKQQQSRISQQPAAYMVRLEPTTSSQSTAQTQFAVKGKTFEQQLKEWEKIFEIWKEQNKNHPNIKEYVQYNRLWQNLRMQLIQQKQQMLNIEVGGQVASSQSATSSGSASNTILPPQINTVSTGIITSTPVKTNIVYTTITSPNAIIYYPPVQYIHLQPFLKPSSISFASLIPAPPAVPTQLDPPGSPLTPVLSGCRNPSMSPMNINNSNMVNRNLVAQSKVYLNKRKYDYVGVKSIAKRTMSTLEKMSTHVTNIDAKNNTVVLPEKPLPVTTLPTIVLENSTVLANNSNQSGKSYGSHIHPIQLTCTPDLPHLNHISSPLIATTNKSEPASKKLVSPNQIQQENPVYFAGQGSSTVNQSTIGEYSTDCVQSLAKKSPAGAKWSKGVSFIDEITLSD